MYQIIIAPQAKRQLGILSKIYKRSIRAALLDLTENPKLGKALGRELSGSYTYRIGVYRIVYKIDEQSKNVNIISVGHRSTIYQ